MWPGTAVKLKSVWLTVRCNYILYYTLVLLQVTKFNNKYIYTVKLNCLCPLHETWRESGGRALLIPNSGARRKCVANFVLRPLYPWERDQLRIEYGAGSTPEPDWTIFGEE